jgi:hypothetical protein
MHTTRVSVYVADKTVGNTAVGVLAHTVPYLQSLLLRSWILTDQGQPGVVPTLRTGSKLLFLEWKILSLTFLASDRIDGNGDVMSA